MRFLLWVAAVWLLAALNLSCDKAGMVTGGTIRHCGSFSDDQDDFVDLALVMVVCPELEKRDDVKAKLDGRPCTASLMRDTIREVAIYFYASGSDYCVDLVPPE